LICDVPVGRGGTWLEDGTIVFGYNDVQMPGSLYRVAARGGTPTPLTTLDTARGEKSHRFPSRVPGGYLLYFVWTGASGGSGLRLVSLDAPTKALAFYPGYLASEYVNGFLVSTREDHWIRAQRLRLPNGALSGDEIAIALSRTADNLGRDAWSLSATGVLANFGPVDDTGQFAWVSRDGRVLGTLGEAVTGQQGVELAPNGQQLVTTRGGKAPWIWDVDAANGAATVVTKTGGQHLLWSPDGESVAFLHQDPPPSATPFTIMTVPISASNATPPAVLLSRPTALLKPVAWTHDGKFVFLQTGGLGFDIWTMSTSDPSTAASYLRDGSSSPEGRLSPDGHWLAYSNDRSGTLEIYVEHFPEAGTPKRISQHGGRFPRWRADGRELYYEAGATLMSVSVTPGDAPSFGTPEVRFEMKLIASPLPLVYGNYEYDVNHDGTRFIVDRLVGEGVPTLDVITNWYGGS
ncbi:MAG: hypothetical protein ACRD1V_11380, partial [Vicinamibacterales bacterium]